MRRAAEGVAILAAALIAAAMAMGPCAPAALAQVALSRQVMGGGGGVHTSTGFTLQGTVGQGVVGASAGPTFHAGHGFWVRGGAAVLDVGDPPGVTPRPVPSRLSLGPATPNPVRVATRFRLALPARAHIRFGLFDLQGRPAGEVVDREVEAGWHDLAWAPPPGAARSAGVFFASLEVDGRRIATQRVVVTP